MSHHDHDLDLDLIMALAEGSLSASEAAAAQRQIERCPDCVEDLELQQTALAAFAATPPVALTDLEAARLKRDLDTALGHERTAMAPTPAKKRGFNWLPVFSVAAVLLALVLVIPSLDLVSGDRDDDAGADAVALDFAEEEADTGASTEPTENPLRIQFATDDAASDGGGDAAGDTAEAPAAAPTTAAAAADEALPVSPEATELIDELDARLAPSDSIDDARLEASLFGLTTTDQADLDRCVPEGAEFFNVPGGDSYTLGDIDLDVGPVRVTAHPQRSDLGLAAHLDESCEIIATNAG